MQTGLGGRVRGSWVSVNPYIRGHTASWCCWVLLGGMCCSSAGAVCLAVEGTASTHPKQWHAAMWPGLHVAHQTAAWLFKAYSMQPAVSERLTPRTGHQPNAKRTCSSESHTLARLPVDHPGGWTQAESSERPM